MITISNTSGKLLRVLPDVSEEVRYGFHTRFGWITEAGARSRSANRTKFGLFSGSSDWIVRFVITPAIGHSGFALQPLDGCQVRAGANASWVLSGPKGEFSVSNAPAELMPLGLHSTEDNRRPLWIAAAALFIIALIFFLPRNVEETLVPEAAPEEPVVVKVVRPARSVVVPMPQAPTQAQVNQTKTRNVIRKDVAFLELLGRKDLSKAVGGRPIELKEVSPGAGAGGKEGSGGEYLVGLGEGIRKTTVGNTGVAGLGGIGTKGRGGGQGGYGDVQVAGGTGSRISNVALSNDLMVEGGLSQAVIQATIAKYLNQIRACYEAGLSKNPGLIGLVSTRFDIGAAGDVESPKVTDSTLGDRGVEDCISGKMSGWKFPKPVGGVKVRVNYPFLLKPVQS